MRIINRQIGEIGTISVMNDNDVVQLEFEIENQLTPFLKLSDCDKVYINYQNGLTKDRQLIQNIIIDGTTAKFFWTLGRNATRKSGKTYFVVCAQRTQGGQILQEWNTILASFDVQKGLEVLTEQTKEYEDIFSQLFDEIEGKQDTLEAGTGITIDGNVISANSVQIPIPTSSNTYQNIYQNVIQPARSAGKICYIMANIDGQSVPHILVRADSYEAYFFTIIGQAVSQFRIWQNSNSLQSTIQLAKTSDLESYLTSAAAALTYLTITNAANTYQKILGWNELDLSETSSTSPYNLNNLGGMYVVTNGGYIGTDTYSANRVALLSEGDIVIVKGISALFTDNQGSLMFVDTLGTTYTNWNNAYVDNHADVLRLLAPYLTTSAAASTYQPKFIRLDNQTILTADWVADASTHSGYSYKKVFNITGVTASSTVNVYPDLATVEAGNLMPVADLASGEVTLFSKTNDAVVIERIEVIN